MKKKLSLLLCLTICLGLTGCGEGENSKNPASGTTQSVIDTSSDTTSTSNALGSLDMSIPEKEGIVDYSSLAPSEGFTYKESYIYIDNEKIEGYEAEITISEPTDVLVIPSEYNGKPIVNLITRFHEDVNTLVVPNTEATLKYFDYSTPSSRVGEVWFEGNTYNYDTFANAINVGCDPRNHDDNGFYLSEDGKTLMRYAPEYNMSDNPSVITVPEGIESIYSYCFTLAKELPLESINLPSTLTKIGVFAFSELDVDTIVMQEGIKEIADSAFRDCEITSLNLSDGLETIGNSAFASCHWLTGDLVIPDSVKSIGHNAFEFNELSSIKIGTGLTRLDDSTIRACEQVKTLIIPANIKELDDDAVCQNDNLESIVFEEGCTSIEHNAFFDNPKLTSVKLPQTLERLEISAFLQCKSLTQLTIPDGTRIVDPRGGSQYCNPSDFNSDLKITYRGKVYPISELEQLIKDSEN